MKMKMGSCQTFFWLFLADVRSAVKRSGLAAQRINFTPASPVDDNLSNSAQNLQDSETLDVTSRSGEVRSRKSELEDVVQMVSHEDSTRDLTGQDLARRNLAGPSVRRGEEKMTAVKGEAGGRGVDLLEQFDKSISPIATSTGAASPRTEGAAAGDSRNHEPPPSPANLVMRNLRSLNVCEVLPKPEILICQIQLHSSAREVSVPATRVGRLMSYGGLVAGIGIGALNEGFKRVIGTSEGSLSFTLSSCFFDVLLETLTLFPLVPVLDFVVVASYFKPVCERRKCGKVCEDAVTNAWGSSEARPNDFHPRLSFFLFSVLSVTLRRLIPFSGVLVWGKTDNKSISPQIREILERVRLSADYMPQKQREASSSCFSILLLTLRLMSWCLVL